MASQTLGDDPSQGPPPAEPPPDYPADMTAFNSLVRRYELSPLVSSQLLEVLRHREIVLLCDDSSSMLNTVVEEGNDPFASNNSTRWQLLKRIAASIIDFVASTTHHGLDLYFLKRPTVRNVTSAQGLQAVFQQPPDEMGTPLISALRRVYDEKRGHRGLLIVVITDGEPNDGSRDDLRRTLLAKPSDCHVSFAEATDNEDDMQYLDAMKGTIPLFDNTDIYRLECQRVKNLQGLQFKFDWTDYVIKILLATFIPQYWNVDQRRLLSSGRPQQYNSGPMIYQSSSAPMQGGGGGQQYVGSSSQVVYQGGQSQAVAAMPVYQAPQQLSSPVYVPYPQQTSVVVNTGASVQGGGGCCAVQ